MEGDIFRRKKCPPSRCSRSNHRRMSRSAATTSRGRPAATRGRRRVERAGPMPPPPPHNLDLCRRSAAAAAQGRPQPVPLGVEPFRRRRRRGRGDPLSPQDLDPQLPRFGVEPCRRRRSGMIHCHPRSIRCHTSSPRRRCSRSYSHRAVAELLALPVLWIPPPSKPPHRRCSGSRHRQHPRAAAHPAEAVTLLPNSLRRRCQRPHATAAEAPALPVVRIPPPPLLRILPSPKCMRERESESGDG
jgi:hypothetical protein